MRNIFKESILDAIVVVLLLWLSNNFILDIDKGIEYYLRNGITLAFVIYLIRLAIYKFKNRKK